MHCNVPLFVARFLAPRKSVGSLTKSTTTLEARRLLQLVAVIWLSFVSVEAIISNINAKISGACRSSNANEDFVVVNGTRGAGMAGQKEAAVKLFEGLRLHVTSEKAMALQIMRYK
eukprot:3700840-Rhodomonas_salina.1